MNRFLQGSFAFAALGASLSAHAQDPFLNASVTGNADLNGSSFTSGLLFEGDLLSLRAGNGNALTSDLAFGPYSENNGPKRRSMTRLKAGGVGTFSLPSDRNGGTASANAGESVIVSTWDPLVYAQGTTHSFNASVSVADENDEAWIDVEVAGAPKPNYAKTGGSFITTLLDGSIYDQDPTSGSVLLNRSLTPTLSLNYTLPEFTFTRNVVTWDDGTETASMFRDEVHSGMWLSFDGTGGSVFAADHGSMEFAPGEGLAQRIVGSVSGTLTVDLSQVADGFYDVRHSAIPWHQEGYDDTLGGGASGFFTDDVFENRVHVVPEPATIAVIGIGIAGVLRRRRR